MGGNQYGSGVGPRRGTFLTVGGSDRASVSQGACRQWHLPSRGAEFALPSLGCCLKTILCRQRPVLILTPAKAVSFL